MSERGLLREPLFRRVMTDYRVINADCMDAMREMDDCSVDAIVTDPPYGLAFMGKDWDYDVPGPDYWREALRVAKPGAHLLCFGGTRTFHRMACAIEDAGWEIRDCVMWVYGCLSEDSEILTPSGWARCGEIGIGDEVVCYDIRTHAFGVERAQATYLYEYDDTAYRIESDATDQLVSRNHRVIVERDGVQEFVLAEQVAQELEACVPVLEGLQGVFDHLSVHDKRTSSEKEDVLEGVLGKGDEHGAEKTHGSRAKHEMPLVREGVLPAASLDKKSSDSLLLGQLQKQGQERPNVDPIQQRAPAADNGGAETGETRGHAWGEEPELEGRRGKGAQPQGEEARGVGEMPERVSFDGPFGWVRLRTQTHSSSEDWSLSLEHGGRSSRGPQPVEQRPVKPDAVRLQRRSQEIRAPWGATTTLARVTPTHYKGKMWCVKVPSGAFVARRNGKVFVTGNSGFPKSMNVSKAIDKTGGLDPKKSGSALKTARERAGMTREELALAVGCKPASIRDWEEGRARSKGKAVEHITPSQEYRDKLNDLLGFTKDEREVIGIKSDRRGDGTVCALGHSGLEYGGPSTEAAKRWDGWGTCLKPAWEPIIVARKPLDGTVAHNVMTHGVGAMNIDGCRVPTSDDLNGGIYSGSCRDDGSAIYGSNQNGIGKYSQPSGRFPANLVHDGSDEVLALFPDSKGQQGDVTGNEPSHPADGVCYGEYNGRHSFAKRGDSGSAARFFYCAKASKKDRGEGNVHPTCKPTALMEWLVRLVTPRGGVVLDPFCGSGTTGVACVREGMDFIGIEREEQYAAIARRRIDGAAAEDKQLSLF